MSLAGDDSKELNLPYPSTIPAPSRGPSDPSALTSEAAADYGNGARDRFYAPEAQPNNRDTDQNNSPEYMLPDLAGSVNQSPIAYPPKIAEHDIANYVGPETAMPLKQALWGSLLPDRVNKKEKFLPRGSLERICHFDAVLKEVLPFHRDKAQAQKCAEFVCGNRQSESRDNRTSSREIFAILVLIDAVEFMPKFQHAEIRDDDLPFRSDDEQTKLWKRKATGDCHIDFFIYPRDRCILTEFYGKQWWVHVPFIGQDDRNKKAIAYYLEPETVMPWTFVDKEGQEKGGFGVVEKIQIHPDHHAFNGHEEFALKTLHEDGQDHGRSFRRETNAFHGIQTQPHMVQLFATFIKGSQYMLLFPWADGGNLESLWETSPTNPASSSTQETRDFAKWIAVQCHGLAEVLQEIHGFLQKKHEHDAQEGHEAQDGTASSGNQRVAGKFPNSLHFHTDDVALIRPSTPANPSESFGIHEDIKPANILHFKNDEEHHLGRLKIADLGLLQFYDITSRTKKSIQRPAFASQTYRSPEHDVSRVMSRKTDIWSLGCVFSEHLTWAIRGPSGVVDYGNKRSEESRTTGDTSGKGTWIEDSFFVKHVQKQGWMRLFGIMPGVDEMWIPRREVPQLKATVTQWIQELIDECSSGEEPNFFANFLTFIEKRMLHPERLERADCEEVVKFLKECLGKGEQRPQYWDFGPRIERGESEEDLR